MEHEDILENLIKVGRIDIIFNCFMNNADIVMVKIKEHIKLPDLEYDYFIATRVGILIGVFQTWIIRGKKESAWDLAQIIINDSAMLASNSFIF